MIWYLTILDVAFLFFLVFLLFIGLFIYFFPISKCYSTLRGRFCGQSVPLD